MQDDRESAAEKAVKPGCVGSNQPALAGLLCRISLLSAPP